MTHGILGLLALAVIGWIWSRVKRWDDAHDPYRALGTVEGHREVRYEQNHGER